MKTQGDFGRVKIFLIFALHTFLPPDGCLPIPENKSIRQKNTMIDDKMRPSQAVAQLPPA
jgi:hypothetical protein